MQSKIDTLGLRILGPLQVSPDIKTPSTWVRIRGDKAYISGHGPQTHEGFIAGSPEKVVDQQRIIDQSFAIVRYFN